MAQPVTREWMQRTFEATKNWGRWGAEDELTLAGQLPIYSYRGRTALKGLAMCAVSPFMALPDPAHAAYNRLAARSKELAARTDPVGCRD